VNRLDKLDRLVSSHRTPDEQAVCTAGFLLILEGEAPDSAALSEATGLEHETIVSVLAGLAERGLLVLESEDGPVVGSWGLSLVPTNHRLRIRGRNFHTWCALDAVGIPAGLCEDAAVVSRCHHCGEPVLVNMAAGAITRAQPHDLHLWVVPSEGARSIVGDT
jgi:hypothetical protein